MKKTAASTSVSPVKWSFSTYTDAFIAEIEDCRFPEEAASLARACAYRCARMVARHLSDDGPGAGSLLAAKVREYIDRHIGECIRVQDIAAELRMSSGHLMRLYREQSGMTLVESVRQRPATARRTWAGRPKVAGMKKAALMRPSASLAQALTACRRGCPGKAARAEPGAAAGPGEAPLQSPGQGWQVLRERRP